MLVTRKEIAEYLRVSEDQVRVMVRKMGLPYVRLGHKTVRFDREKVDAWVEIIRRNQHGKKALAKPQGSRSRLREREAR